MRLLSGKGQSSLNVPRWSRSHQWDVWYLLRRVKTQYKFAVRHAEVWCLKWQLQIWEASKWARSWRQERSLDDMWGLNWLRSDHRLQGECSLKTYRWQSAWDHLTQHSKAAQITRVTMGTALHWSLGVRSMTWSPMLCCFEWLCLSDVCSCAQCCLRQWIHVGLTAAGLYTFVQLIT